MSAVASSSLAERVRAAVACLRDVDPGASSTYLLVEYPSAGEAEPRGAEPRVPRRLAVVRIYDGAHKGLEQRHTVLVGFDLASPGAGLVAVPFASHRATEVTASGKPIGGVDAPFQGVLDLRGVALK